MELRNIFKDIFKKNKKIQTQELKEYVMKENIYFQWLSGAKIGKVVEYVGTEIDDGVLYIKLADGSRCNRDYVSLLNEFNITDNVLLAHISSPDNKWVAHYEDIPAIEEQ